MRLCRADRGSAKSFTCAYHGWTYDTGGGLLGIPGEPKYLVKTPERSEWSAHRVPRLHVFKGFVFGTWDESAPDFEEYVGDVAEYLNVIFDGGVDGMEVVGGVEKWTIAANWKLSADQFVSDDSHFPFTHASGLSATLRASPELAAKMRMPTPDDSRHVRSKYGHGIGFSTDAEWHEIRQELSLGRDIVAYCSGPHRQANVAKYGEAMGKDFGLTHGLIFPNLGFVGLGMFRQFHPRGPGGTEIHDYVMVPKHAPRELKERWRIEALHTFGSAGIFEQEDGEHWTTIQRNLQSARARKALLNVQLGFGQTSDPQGRFPGTTDAAVTEAGTRAFYKRWVELMATARPYERGHGENR